MDGWREKVAVESVESQVVLVVGVHLPHFVEQDHKLYRIS